MTVPLLLYRGPVKRKMLSEPMGLSKILVCTIEQTLIRCYNLIKYLFKLKQTFRALLM